MSAYNMSSYKSVSTANKVGINMDQLYEKIKRSNSRTSMSGDAGEISLSSGLQFILMKQVQVIIVH